MVEEFPRSGGVGGRPAKRARRLHEAARVVRRERHPTIIVENASRFARDLDRRRRPGHAMLKAQGIALIAADDPDAFTADTPTARLVRQILGAVSEFEKANLVAKLKGARDRASTAAGRRVEGRKGYAGDEFGADRRGEAVGAEIAEDGESSSLREIADELAQLGFTTASGKTFSAAQVQRQLRQSASSNLTPFPKSACVRTFSGSGGPCSCSPRRSRPTPAPCPRSSFRPFWGAAGSAHSGPRSTGRSPPSRRPASCNRCCG